jgi:protocatechuate 3,4-dioxygenase beta subunit
LSLPSSQSRSKDGNWLFATSYRSDTMTKPEPTISRRSVVWMLLSAPVAAFLAACQGLSTAERSATQITAQQSIAATRAAGTTAAATPAPAQPSTEVVGVTTLEPTPECSDDDEETVEQTEGPYYTPNTPERTSLLEPGISGTPLLLTGFVLGTDCTPVAAALIDFWHCDDNGDYDNVGYKLRGHQFTDADGRYTLETIMPGVYPGRTRHIHVKVQAPNQPVLTTQLYFPGEPQNSSDGIYDARLEMVLTDGANGKDGKFDFVVDVA